jgi:ferrochelatase
MSKSIGVLVMSYGTPANLEDVEPYYTHIRRGNPPTAKQLADLRSRYEAIGGVSPLTLLTRGQIESLETRLNQRAEGTIYRAYSGLKHTHPFIHEAVGQLVKDGIEEAVGIVLAPHYSTFSVAAYQKYAREAAQVHGLKRLLLVDQYHLEPLFIDAWVKRVEDALARFPQGEHNQVKVLFTAHSLPTKILEMDDPYPTQIRETAQTIAARIGLENWDTGWQSAGQTGVPWLGPDILDHLRLLQEEGTSQILIAPIGFVSDHLEVLYDIDIECQGVARELGIHLERTESLNTDPLYIEALANMILKKIESAS